MTTLLAFPSAAVAPLEVGPAQLLADTVTTPAPPLGLDPHDQAELGGIVYFAATDPLHGDELWRSDGTPEGTGLLVDLAPGSIGSLPSHLTAVGNVFYFTALGDGRQGLGLWKSDGTAQGTVPVTSFGDTYLAPKGRFERPSQLAALGDRLIFTTATTNPWDGGSVLWASSGTAESTVPLKRVSGTVSESFWAWRQPPVVANSRAFLFTWLPPFGPRTLWVTDGTPGGTQSLSTLENENGSLEAPPPLVPWMGGVVFSRRTPDELWFSDGTVAGTYRLEALAAQWPFSMAAVGAWLYLYDDSGKLLRTDGVSGTSLVHAPGCNYATGRMVALADKLLASCGPNLYGTDGVTTELLLQLPGNLAFRSLRSNGQRAYFEAEAQATGSPGLIGGSDGTVAGSEILRTGFSSFGQGADTPATEADRYLAPLASSSLFVSSSGRAFFRATQEVVGNAARLLAAWTSDGTPEGTRALATTPRSLGADPADYTALTGNTFFGTRSEITSPQPALDVSYGLWRADASGATLIKSLPRVHPCIASYEYELFETCRATDLQSVAGRLYFVAGAPGTAGELRLWVSDGTEGGTIALGPPLRSTRPAALGSQLVFVADDGVHGPAQAWITDGTPTGTQLLADLCPSPGDCSPSYHHLQLAPSGGRVFLAAPDRLWVTDGTGAGTRPLLDGTAADLVDAQGTLYFSRAPESPGFGSPWRLCHSDGTVIGTTCLETGILSGLSRMVALGSRAFFAAFDPSGLTPEHQLWMSDGTSAGTQVVIKDFKPGSASVSLGALQVAGDRLFFSVTDEVSGRELWVSDGTLEGTQRVTGVQVGGDGGDFAWDGQRLYFPGYRVDSGVELWSTDGTEAGTQLVQDIAPGALSSSPSNLAVVGERLYFTADDGRTGREPWTLALGAPQATLSQPSVLEGDDGVSWLDFEVRLRQASTAPLSLDWNTTGGTASAGSDYGPLWGTLAFAPGESVKTAHVPVFGDRVREADETVALELHAGAQHLLSAEGRIRDDDAADIGPRDTCAYERPNGPALAHITVEAATRAPASTWNYASEPGTAESGTDYRAVSGQIVLGGDTTSATIDVPILPDSLREGPESFALRLTPSAGGTSLAATVTILDSWSRADFDGDGESDLLFWNHDSGALQIWALNGVLRTGVLSTTPFGVSDTRWRAAGTGDFNDDGRTDVLWRHSVSGKLVVWLMNGTERLGGTFTVPDGVSDLRWRLAATGDLDADGQGDLVWQHTDTGRVVVWSMNGVTRIQGGYLVPESPGSPNWRLVGAADFDGDGRSDVLFEHAATGRLVGWSLTGLVRRGGQVLSPDGYQDPASGHPWRVQRIGDYNDDGHPDLLWRNVTDGGLRVWLMEGWDRKHELALEPSVQTLDWE